MTVLSEDEVLRLLCEQVQRAGGQSAWARTHRISRPLLNKVINKKEPIPKSILKVLCIKTIFVRED